MKKKSITKKFTIAIISVLLICTLLLVANNVYFINKDIQEKEQTLLKKRKSQLKNYVEIAYNVIEKGHKENKSKKEILEYLESMRYDEGIGYFWINDMAEPYPNMIMHPTVPELNGKKLNMPKYDCALGEGKNLFAAMVDVCKKRGEGFVDYLWPKPTKDGLTEQQPKISYVKSFDEWSWIIGSGVYVDDIQKELDDYSESQTKVLLSQIAIIVIVFIGVIFFAIIALRRMIIKPLSKANKFANSIASGNLSEKLDVHSGDEIGQLAESLRNMNSNLQDVSAKTRSISEGDLTVKVKKRSEKDELMESLSNMTEKLKTIIGTITTSSENVSTASKEMSSNSQQVSQGASEQASAAEEISSSMEEMASNIQQNTENAQQTEKIAAKAAEDITEGSENVNQTVDAMKKIAEKVSIIGDIAEQTNMLALNAAVEAARAGEHGKGFAVVAAEVRKLAEKSQSSAAEIDELTKSSVDVAERSGGLLQKIVPDIQKTSKLVQEITAASNEQNNGADQINNAINQLNEITQQNASASEEMATSSEELSSQADRLLNITSYFRMNGEYKSEKDTMLNEQQESERQIQENNECESLVNCGFFKKYKEGNDLLCKGLINKYCKGEYQNKCKRKEYKETNGTPPHDDMMPNGAYIQGTNQHKTKNKGVNLNLNDEDVSHPGIDDEYERF